MSPPVTANLHLDLDASAITGLTDGTPVSSWADISGSGNTATASGTARPVYKTNIVSGLPIVRFNGSSTHMDIPSAAGLNIGTAATVFVVYIGQAGQVVLAKRSNTDVSFWEVAHANTGGDLFRAARSGSDVIETGPGGPGAFEVVTNVYDGGNLTIWRDGGSAASAQTGSVSNSTSLTVGARSNYPGAEAWLNGDVAEILVYNAALSTTDRNAVETWLLNKWLTTAGTAGDPPPNTWYLKRSMPAALAAVAAAALGGVLHVVGGYADTGFTLWSSIHRAYDPTTDSWSTLAPLPVAKGFSAAAAVGGLLYVIGGTGIGPAAVATVHSYDPSTDSWTAKASLPAPRGDGPGAAVLGGKIHIAGGYATNSNVGVASATDHYVYDPATNAWTTAASLPAGRGYLFGSAVLGGLWYLPSGEVSGGVPTTTHYVYDSGTNSWASKAAVPSVPQMFRCVLSVNSVPRVHIVCSDGSHYRYDESADTWSARAPKLVLGVNDNGDVINNRLFLAGANNGSSILAAVEEHTPGDLMRWRTGAVVIC